MGANGACYVCYESQPPPIQSGCACRDEAGFVHIECMVQVAVSQVGHRGNIAWSECHTCKQKFTGAMRTGLAEACWGRVRDVVEESAERLSAAYNLGQSLFGEAKYGEAERMFREVHGILMRVLGADRSGCSGCRGNRTPWRWHRRRELLCGGFDSGKRDARGDDRRRSHGRSAC
jgi:hypothetical protein